MKMTKEPWTQKMELDPYNRLQIFIINLIKSLLCEISKLTLAWILLDTLTFANKYLWGEMCDNANL
jgi:hypothetical protein